MPERIGLEAILDMAHFNNGMGQYLSGLDRMSGKTSSFAGKAAAGFQSFGTAILGIGGILADVTVTAAAAAGTAVAKFTLDGIRSAMNLDAQLSTIAATLNKTKDEVGPLKDLILDLGLDPNLVVTADQASEAIENLARNGLSMQQILDGAARSTVLLANATGSDFGQAADIATDVMGQFKIKASDLDKAVNGITATTNVSKMTIDDYALAIGQAGGVAGALGVSFDDFNTSLAATSPLFNSGSDAGTSYKTFLQRLVPTTKAQIAAQKALGLEFFDAQGNMKSMAEVSADLNRVLHGQIQVTTEVGGRTEEQDARLAHLGTRYNSLQQSLQDYQTGVSGANLTDEQRAKKIAEINAQIANTQTEMGKLTSIQGTLVESTKTLTEEEKNRYLSVLFGTDAMRTALGLADAGAVIYTDAAAAARELGVSQEEVNKVIEGGVTQFEALQLQMGLVDANEQAATRMDNLKGKFNILQGQIETVSLAVGDKFLPLLESMAGWLIRLASQYGPSVIAFFGDLATKIEAGAGVVQVLMQMMETGELVSATEFGLAASTAAMADSWVTSVLQINDSINQFIGAIRLVTDPIVEMITHFVTWRDVMTVVGLAVASVVIPAIWGIIVALAPMIVAVGGALAAVTAMRIAWESDWLGIRTATNGAIASIIEALNPFTQAFREHGVGALNEIKAFVTGNETEWTNVKAIWAGAREAGQNLFSGIKDFVTTNLPGWIATLQEWGNAAGQWIYDATLVVHEKMLEWWGVLSAYVTDNLPAWQAKLAEWGNQAWQWIADAVSPVQTKLGEWWGAISQYVTDNLPAWTAKLTEWGNAAWQWIADASALAYAEVGKWATGLLNTLADNLPGWTAKLKEFGNAAWQWLTDAATLAYAALGRWTTGLLNTLAANLPGWTAKLKEWGNQAWLWIQDATTLALVEVGKWATGLLNQIAADLPGWQAKLKEWSDAAWQWIQGAATTAMTELGKYASNLVAEIGRQLPGWTAKLKEWADEAWQWIQDASALAVAELGRYASNLASEIGRKLPTWTAKLKEWADKAWQWIQDATSTAITQLGAWAAGLIRKLGEELPSFRNKLLDFATAMVEWISSKVADALPALGRWLGKLTGWVKLAIPIFVAAMIRFATAIVEWLTDPEADPVGKLGEWLKKATDWITGAAQTFTKAMVDFAHGIVDWITGEDAQPDPHLDKFKAALVAGIGRIKEGFLAAVDEFAQGWWDTIEQVDWQKLGQTVLNTIKDGIVSVKDSLLSKLGEIASGMMQKFKDIDWLQLGKDIIQGIMDGLDNMKDAIFDKMKEIASGLPDWMKNILGMQSPSKVFMEIGENIVLGLAIGIDRASSRATDSIKSLTDSMVRNALQKRDDVVKSFAGFTNSLLGVGSGFASQVGEGAPETDTYNSLKAQYELLKKQADLVGLIRDNGGDVGEFLGGLQLGTNADPTKILVAINRATQLMTDNLHKSLLVASQGFDAIVNNLRNARRSVEDIEAQFTDRSTSVLEIYKQRVTDLDEQIAQAEAKLLADGTQQSLNTLTGLQASRQSAAQTLEDYLKLVQANQRAIHNLQVVRRSADDIEEAALKKSVTGYATYRDKILDLDQQIAETEAQLLAGAGQQQMDHLNVLQRVRQAAASDYESYLDKLSALNKKLATIPTTGNSRGSAALEAFRKSSIDPLVEHFNKVDTTSGTRDTIDALISQRVDAMNTYAQSLERVQDREERLGKMMESVDFGAAFKSNIQNLIDSLYNVTAGNRSTLLITLDRYVLRAEELFNTFNQIGNGDETFAQLKENYAKPLLQQLLDINLTLEQRTKLFSQYTNALAVLDRISVGQGKVGAIQGRINLVNQVKDLSSQLKDPAAFARIFAGLDPSKSFSPEQLAGVIARYTDEAIRLANRQLTEALQVPPPNLDATLNTLRSQRRDVDAMVKAYTTSIYSYIEVSRDQIAKLDTQITEAEKNAVESGSAAALELVKVLTGTRVTLANDLEQYMIQIANAERSVALLHKATNDRAAQAAQKFKEQLIDPLVNTLQFPMRAVERDSVVRLIAARTEKLNRYIDQLNTLSTYEKDLSAASQINPLVGRFADERINTLLAKLYDINTAESERVNIANQLVVEQQKLLDLQQKQSQLNYLNEQLNLLKQIQQMNEEFDDVVSMTNILNGIKFGVDASLDDMLTLTSRTIDAMIATVKKQLGIASPSKVFAQIGKFSMQGLTQGILQSVQGPLDAMRSASVALPANITNRTMNLNFGTTINTPMDESLFRSMVRREVEGMLFA